MSVNPTNIQKTKGLSELWKRLRFVLLAVVIYRIGTHIPIPGIDPDKLASLFQQNQGTLLDLFNMFSGGALERMSIMALNIMPYICRVGGQHLFAYNKVYKECGREKYPIL